MNEWECEKCGRKVVGVGNAIGLLAIGWYFEVGPKILCPSHHPHGIAEANFIAERLQTLIMMHTEKDGGLILKEVIHYCPGICERAEAVMVRLIKNE